jgi:hypothetical protein
MNTIKKYLTTGTRWNETNIKVEATFGGIDVIDGKPRRRRGWMYMRKF